MENNSWHFLVRDIHPMAHIVRYLLDKELRPVELIRIMDKTVSFKLTTKEFFSRCLVKTAHY